MKKQYKKHKTADDFDYDMNFLTREILTSRKLSQNNSICAVNFQEILNDEKKAEDYIISLIEALLEDGMRFFKEFSPALSYKVLTKHGIIENDQICQLRNEISLHIGKVSQMKESWWKRIIKQLPSI